MRDYIIWCGEKLNKVLYWMSWEEIMEFVMGEVPGFDIDKLPSFSVDAYLAEVRG